MFPSSPVSSHQFTYITRKKPADVSSSSSHLFRRRIHSLWNYYVCNRFWVSDLCLHLFQKSCTAYCVWCLPGTLTRTRFQIIEENKITNVHRVHLIQKRVHLHHFGGKYMYVPIWNVFFLKRKVKYYFLSLGRINVNSHRAGFWLSGVTDVIIFVCVCAVVLKLKYSGKKT